MSKSAFASSPLPLDLSSKGGGRLFLGLAVVATMGGSLVTALRTGGSGWNAWLFLDQGFSHAAAFRTELTLVLVAMAFAVAGLLLRHHRWGGCLMLPAFGYLLAEACLIAKMGGVGHAEWAPAAHAMRYATPFALALLAMKEPFGEAQVTMLLRVSLAMVFLTHGAEALLHFPRFIDLIIGSAENLVGWRVTEAQAKSMLTAIGAVDVVAAVLVLARPTPALLWWMAAWGLITALSRMTCLGLDAYREVLLRATHFLVPLALVLYRRKG
ncbi:MAG: hypothetical protein JNJ70_11720 [Verrucomicrobiales bacterium]|nr:hypothetical protein [Verrucomicrobiales bacterium]